MLGRPHFQEINAKHVRLHILNGINGFDVCLLAFAELRFLGGFLFVFLP